MDAFFASVEVLDHPDWRGKPLIVGAGPHERGVVSTCSYEARAFGVHSAMPSRTAYARCPQAVFATPRMARYHEVSEQAFSVFARYSPFVEAVSIDEAFLDITGTLHLYARPGEPSGAPAAMRRLGEALRRDIRATCGVTCSVGIAPNRLLAKIGSELRKPDGLSILPFDPDEVAAFLAPRPLNLLWGFGKKTEEQLRPYGLVTCGDLQRLDPDTARQIVPDGLRDLAFGRSDDRVYWEERAEKSVSREHTFDTDVFDRTTVRAKLLELAAEVGRSFRRERRWARTVRIKLRDSAFATLTRQTGLDRPARDDVTFRTAALRLFDKVLDPHAAHLANGVRLVGFGVADFQDSPDSGQGLLFDDPDDTRRDKFERLSRALDRLHDHGLRAGALVTPPDGATTP